MKRLLTRESTWKGVSFSLVFSLVFSVCLCVMNSIVWAENVTVEKVIKLHTMMEFSAEDIQAYLKRKNAQFNLKLSDVKKLEDAGVPQAVIDSMMGGTQQGAAPAPEVAPEPEKTTPPEMTEDQRKIEEAKRLAAEKAERQAREDLKKARLAQVKKQLKRAQSLLDQGDYSKSLKAFDDYLQLEDQVPEGTAKARFGFAESLFGLKLYANAMVNYKDILNIPPEANPVFKEAFDRLRECSQIVSYEDVPASLTDHYIAEFPQEFQDSYNYFLGRLFFKATDMEQARLYLERVKPQGPDYARSQYILGLIAVKEVGIDFTKSSTLSDEAFPQLAKATTFFRRAITMAEDVKYVDELRRIREIANLAIARIAYKLGDRVPSLYDVALYHYRKIPSDSTNYSAALYEAAWSYFLKGNFRRGIGIFHTLEGPDWEHHYFPDTYLLEAQLFLNLCRIETAERAIKRLKDRYVKHREALVLYNDTYDVDTLYNAFVKKKLNKGINIPRTLRLAIIAKPEFYHLYTNVKRYAYEVEEIKRNQALFGDEFAQRLLEEATALLDIKREALGTTLKVLLDQLQSELKKLADDVERMEFEIETTRGETLQDEINTGEEKNEANQADSQQTANLLVGDKYQTWSFEGEFWADEINNYRSYLKSKCVEKER